MYKILFFGDSITDHGRNRETDEMPNSLGYGFVSIVQNKLSSISCNYKVINRGNGGNRVIDLADRLQTDVIDLNPDFINILVGVNDVWAKLHGTGVDIVTFEKTYQKIINKIRLKLPRAILTMCEPCFIHGYWPDQNYEHFKEIYLYAKKCEEIARRNNIIYIKYQNDIGKLANEIGNEKVFFDGVHPTEIGCKLLAEKWLNVFLGIVKNI